MATILIVDDDPGCRRPLTALLKHEGYQVTEASNGIEGLQRLRERAHDLVLLDMIMPGMDGVAMLQGIRHNPKWLKLPVLMVTCHHDPQMQKKARDLGVQEYIFKGDTPFCKMLEMIKRHLGEHFVPRRRGRKPKHRPETALPPGMQNKPTVKPGPQYTPFQLMYVRGEA